MKPSQTTQTILVFSSWTGNLILTGLAFALAFRSSVPLSPLTFLTIAFCILLGNALPIAVHWINYRWSKAMLEAEAAEAELTLRSAVARMEGVESRLQDIYEASSKGLLIARQVPERINEKITRLESLLESLDADSLSGLGDGLAKHGQQLSENLASSQELEERLRRWIEETGQMNERNGEDRQTLEVALQGLVQSWGKDVSARLEEFVVAAQGLKAPDKAPDPETGLADVDVLEGEVEAPSAVEPKEEMAAELLEVKRAVEEEPQEELPAKAEVAEDESADDDEEFVTAELEAEAEDLESDDFDAEEDDVEDEDEGPTVADSAEAEEPKAAAPKKPQAQEAWEDLLAAGSADIQKTQDDKVVVIAKCMVGIRNRIHARGEGGGLSWEEGIPLELIGIGEYRLELKDVKKPITLKLILNDQQWAKGDNLTIHPGQFIRVQPKF